MNIADVEKYINDIPKFAGKHALAETKLLCDELTGGADWQPRIIHVAGTNGKGSVCAFMRSALTKAGYSVGFFTSPHLVNIRERICIDYEMISESDFVSAFTHVQIAVSEVAAALKQTDHPVSADALHPSYFEYLFLMAMWYFSVKKPDVIILEVGLGGRLDATNIISQPSLCVITEIGLDHMQYLGNTIAEIAGEKAGIIKPGVPVVYADRKNESTGVIQKRAEELQAPSYPVYVGDIAETVDERGISFAYDSVQISVSSKSVYQKENAALAYEALLKLSDERLTKDIILAGIKESSWTGRMQEILPNVYVDGAHNTDGIEAFLKSVLNISVEKSGTRSLLFGVVADKQYEEMIGNIAASGLFDKVYVCILETNRSVNMDELQAVWGRYPQMSCQFYDNVTDAFATARSEQTDDTVLFAVGSLYLVGQILSLVV